jgi:hypothetical protein
MGQTATYRKVRPAAGGGRSSAEGEDSGTVAMDHRAWHFIEEAQWDSVRST